MKARDVMVSEVYKVKESDSVRTVIEKFIAHGISGVPVVNEVNKIVGYISDGDIMRFLGADELSAMDLIAYTWWPLVPPEHHESLEEKTKRLLDQNVMELARKKPITINWEAGVEEIAALLGKKRIKKLPVERDGVLVGIISRGNIVREVFKQFV